MTSLLVLPIVVFCLNYLLFCDASANSVGDALGNNGLTTTADHLQLQKHAAWADDLPDTTVIREGDGILPQSAEMGYHNDLGASANKPSRVSPNIVSQDCILEASGRDNVAGSSPLTVGISDASSKQDVKAKQVGRCERERREKNAAMCANWAGGSDPLGNDDLINTADQTHQLQSGAGHDIFGDLSPEMDDQFLQALAYNYPRELQQLDKHGSLAELSHEDVEQTLQAIGNNNFANTADHTHQLQPHPEHGIFSDVSPQMVDQALQAFGYNDVTAPGDHPQQRQPHANSDDGTLPVLPSQMVEQTLQAIENNDLAASRDHPQQIPLYADWDDDLSDTTAMREDHGIFPKSAGIVDQTQPTHDNTDSTASANNPSRVSPNVVTQKSIHEAGGQGFSQQESTVGVTLPLNLGFSDANSKQDDAQQVARCEDGAREPNTATCARNARQIAANNVHEAMSTAEFVKLILDQLDLAKLILNQLEIHETLTMDERLVWWDPNLKSQRVFWIVKQARLGKLARKSERWVSHVLNYQSDVLDENKMFLKRAPNGNMLRRRQYRFGLQNYYVSSRLQRMN